jgi:Holliday junction resolvase RusA-like endonuclease
MKTVYCLFVNGIPKAQPRPRMSTSGHVYNPPSADAWKEEIKVAFLPYRHRKPLTEPIHLRVDFFLPKPKRLKIGELGRVPHTKKPDADNLLKAVMDAMTEAGVWKDDALVFWPECPKWYAQDKTGAKITVDTY